MSSAGYQKAFDQFTHDGYRPRWVSTYALAGRDLYAAIWEKSPGPAWEARPGMSEATFQAKSVSLAQQGYRLRCVNACSTGGPDKYAAIWEQMPGPAAVAHHGMTSASTTWRGTVSHPDVRGQMLAHHPLGIRVAWSGGGAHFVAVTGVEEGADTSVRSGEFAQLMDGPHAGAVQQELARLQSDPTVSKGSYDLALLRVPALFTVAVWLQDKAAQADVIVPVPPADPALQPGRHYTPVQFIEALAPSAKQKLVDTDPTKGG